MSRLKANEKVHYVASTTFTIDRRFSDLKAIGKGSYGVVCSANDSLAGGKVAIKKITPMAKQVEDARHVLREIRLMRHMGKHENIISLKDLIVREASDELYIVMELLDSDLHRVLQSKQPLTENHFRYFLFQILCGVKYLHDNRIIHRDLKPGNILVSRDCKLRITDFGLAREKSGSASSIDSDSEMQPMTEHVVTRWYRPPELMLVPDGLYSYSIDIWSVGCILGEMLGRTPMFPGKNFIHQLSLIFDAIGSPRSTDVSHITNIQALKFLSTQNSKRKVPFATLYPAAPSEATDLLERLLVFDPDRRATVDEALKSAYLQEIGDDTPSSVFPPTSREFEFEFERTTMSRSELKSLIAEEARSFHSELYGSGSGSTRSSVPATRSGSNPRPDPRTVSDSMRYREQEKEKTQENKPERSAKDLPSTGSRIYPQGTSNQPIDYSAQLKPTANVPQHERFDEKTPLKYHSGAHLAQQEFKNLGSDQIQRSGEVKVDYEIHRICQMVLNNNPTTTSSIPSSTQTNDLSRDLHSTRQPLSETNYYSCNEKVPVPKERSSPMSSGSTSQSTGSSALSSPFGRETKHLDPSQSHHASKIAFEDSSSPLAYSSLTTEIGSGRKFDSGSRIGSPLSAQPTSRIGSGLEWSSHHDSTQALTELRNSRLRDHPNSPSRIFGHLDRANPTSHINNNDDLSQESDQSSDCSIVEGDNLIRDHRVEPQQGQSNLKVVPTTNQTKIPSRSSTNMNHSDSQVPLGLYSSREHQSEHLENRRFSQEDRRPNEASSQKNEFLHTTSNKPQGNGNGNGGDKTRKVTVAKSPKFSVMSWQRKAEQQQQTHREMPDTARSGGPREETRSRSQPRPDRRGSSNGDHSGKIQIGGERQVGVEGRQNRNEPDASLLGDPRRRSISAPRRR